MPDGPIGTREARVKKAIYWHWTADMTQEEHRDYRQPTRTCASQEGLIQRTRVVIRASVAIGRPFPWHMGRGFLIWVPPVYVSNGCTITSDIEWKVKT